MLRVGQGLRESVKSRSKLTRSARTDDYRRHAQVREKPCKCRRCWVAVLEKPIEPPPNLFVLEVSDVWLRPRRHSGARGSRLTATILACQPAAGQWAVGR